LLIVLFRLSFGSYLVVFFNRSFSFLSATPITSYCSKTQHRLLPWHHLTQVVRSVFVVLVKQNIDV